MEVRSQNTLLDARISQRFGQTQAAPVSRTPAPASATNDMVGVSRDLVAVSTASAGQTRLLREVVEPVDRGFRRTQTFERLDGRTFTKMEEFTATDRNSRRTVIQQNASGSTTRLDEVLERQIDGTFRRTQRFTDEAGETTTQIETGYVSNNPFILSGGAAGNPATTPDRTGLRGTQLDLQA